MQKTAAIIITKDGVISLSTKGTGKFTMKSFVVRGEFLLPIDMFDSWDEELDKMNEDKKGRPYEFPESFIKIQAVWHQCWLEGT